MRFLFCNDNYPGRFGSMPSRLASDPANTVMFLSFRPRQGEASKGVVHARLNLNRDRGRMVQSRDAFLAEWEKMFHLGRQALQTFIHIRDSGFIPDVVLVSFFDGPALFLRHAFPNAFIVSYFNGFRGKKDSPEDILKFQAVMDLQRSMVAQSDLYFVRSETQKLCFPRLLQPVIHVWPVYVDTEFFSPRSRDLSYFFPALSSEGEKELVTVHMKGGGGNSKQMMQVVLGLLIHRPDSLVALTFGKGAAKEHWEGIWSALPPELRERLFLAEGLDNVAYHKLLCSTTIHMFPESIHPPLQEMLESMSCETLLMMPLEAKENGLLRDGENMISMPEGNGEAQLKKICHVLDHAKDFEMVRKNARRTIEKNHSESVVFDRHIDILMNAYAAHHEEHD